MQHLTLWIGFVGAMLAARDGRLLSLTGDSSWLPERWSTAAGILAGVAPHGRRMGAIGDPNDLLIAVTEKRTRAEMDALVEVLEGLST